MGSSTVITTTTSLAASAVAASIYVSRVVTPPREAIPHDQAEPPTTSQGVWATIQLLAQLDAAGLAQWEAFELLLQFGCMIDHGVPLGVAQNRTLLRATTRANYG